MGNSQPGLRDIKQLKLNRGQPFKASQNLRGLFGETKLLLFIKNKIFSIKR
jgi:hypothetical protein